MGELEPLAGAGEDHLVVADDGATAQRRESDRAGLAHAGDAVAAGDARLREIDGAALGRRFAEQDGGAGGRIDLHPVMHLDDLDVPVGAERRRDLPDQGGQKIDAEAHVAGADDRRALRRLRQLGQMPGLQPGRADDMEDAGLGSELREGNRRIGSGEIEHAVSRSEGGGGIARHLDAGGGQAGENPGIIPERGGARPLDRRPERATLGLVDSPDQHPAHPPGGTDDDETHITHGRQAPVLHPRRQMPSQVAQ